MKKLNNSSGRWDYIFPKFDLKMKFSLLFSLVIMFQIQAGTGYSQRTKVSLDMTEATLLEVMDEIESISDFKFFYSKDELDLDRKVDIQARKQRIERILKRLFPDGLVTYKVIETQIVLRKKDKIATYKGPMAPIPVQIEDALIQFTVSGTILDDQGTPLPGASIVEKGTSNGTQTDFDGNFTMTVADTNAILEISYLGFKSVEFPLNGQTTIQLTLQLDTASLEEVVVVGYGGIKRKEITSSIVSVDTEDFNRGNVSDPVQLLQGKVAGLQIGRAGGNPNQPFVIRLRGINSLTGDAAPLVVIDGVLGGSLDALDPNDIESVEVLKDASAAAIYGARASAGVLIITTRSGKGAVTKPRLTVTSQVSFESIANQPEIATAEQYLALGGQDLGGNTDWVEAVSRTGVSQIYNISYGGSTESGLSYQASLNYRDNESIINNSSSFEQLNGRINISQRMLNDKLTLNTIIATTSRTEDQGFQQSLTQALFFNPTAPIRNSDGSFFETQDQDRYNPVAIEEQNTRDRQLNRHVFTFGADYRLTENTVLSGIYTTQRSSELIGEYSARDALWGGGLVNGWARRATEDNRYQQFDWTLTHNGELGKMDYTVTLGQSWNYENIQSAVVSNTDFITDEFSYNNLAAGQGINRNGVVPGGGEGRSDVPQSPNVAQPQNFVGSLQEESISNAYFARLNLNYDDAFFVSGTYRREGSSRFGANNRWGNFWALSGGADIAKIFKLPLDQLKFRAGYGVTGTLPDEFTGYLGTLRLASGGFANGQFISGITPATGANPDLKWEEKAELNLGIDFALFDSRLRGSFDYFKRNTTDLLNRIDVPSPPNPVAEQLLNVGELETSGIELQLSYDVLNKKDFNWTVDANLSTAKTKLIEFNPNTEQTIIRSRGLEGAVAIGPIQPIWTTEGEEIGQIYAQPFVRYAENGDPIVRLKDGTEAVFDPGVFLDEAVNVGDALPDLFVGLTNNFRYKNFDLNIFLRGAFGHSMINETRAAYENVSGIGIRNVVVTEGEFDESITVPHYSTRYVEDASFVRIDNMTLGYTLPKFKNSPFTNFRVFVNGQNLATFTGYKGADPDVRYFDPPSNSEGRRGNSFGGELLFPGIDRYITFLPVSIFSLGVNVGF